VNRADLVEALEAQPFETDVVVNVGGFLIDVSSIDFDPRRHTIVLELFPDDAEDALRHFLRGGPRITGMGNTY
jgi:hypothetical protein